MPSMPMDSGVIVLLVRFFLPCPQMKYVPQGPQTFKRVEQRVIKSVQCYRKF